MRSARRLARAIATRRTPRPVPAGTGAAQSVDALNKQIRASAGVGAHSWHIEHCGDKSPYLNAIGYCAKGDGDDERFELAEAEAEGGGGDGWSVFNPFTGTAATDADIKFQWGSPPTQGKRNDIHDLAAAATNTSIPLSDSVLNNEKLQAAYLRYPNGTNALRQMAVLNKPRALDSPPTVVVLWGETGTGKTHHINHLIRLIGKPHYALSTGQGGGSGTIWFDGYDGQSVLWLSEFRSSIPFAKTLEICDKYECKVQKKNGMSQILADTIFFCSPTDPERWYPNLEERDGLIGQLRRRITYSIRMDGVGGNNRSLECISKLTALYHHFGFQLDGSAWAADLELGDEEMQALVNDLCGDEDELQHDPVIAPPAAGSPPKRRRRHVPVDSDDESDGETIASGYALGFHPGGQAQHAQGI